MSDPVIILLVVIDFELGKLRGYTRSLSLLSCFSLATLNLQELNKNKKACKLFLARIYALSLSPTMN